MHNPVTCAFAGILAVTLVTAGVADARPGGGVGGRGAATSIQRPSGGNFNGGNRAAGNLNANGNRNFNGNGNFNNNVNANRNVNVNANRNINANVNRNVNVNVDNGWNHGGYYYHPIATGVAVGAAVAVTAAAIGSMAYSLPPSCVTRVYPTGSYYSCGGTWYQPQYSGSQVTYVVVNSPG
jgi:hypothetical protein